MSGSPLAVLGATGRVGRALQRRVGVAHLRGLARHAPEDATSWAAFVAADRRDEAALARLIDGCDTVIDLCAFSAADGDALARAWTACAQPPRLLLLASALAELPTARWAQVLPADVHGPGGLNAFGPPSDPYGAGKRAARRRLEAVISGFEGEMVSLLLPQLFAADDPNARELTYLRDARELGAARLPGTGRQRICVVSVDDVAAILLRLAHQPARAAVTAYAVAPPQQPPLCELVVALLRGAGLPTSWCPHPEPHWRGPHSGGDERVAGGPLRERLGDLPWTDLSLALAAWASCAKLQRLGGVTAS